MSDVTSAPLLRPAGGEVPEYFTAYVDGVPEGPLLPLLAAQPDELRQLLSGVGEEQAMRGYAPGKWSIKEVVGHLVDGERVFSYRCLAIARGESAHLPGMDQDLYVEGGRFNRRPLADLLDEYQAQRRSSICLFRSLDEESLERRGVANGQEIAARLFPFLIAGHHIHHVSILRSRYLTGS